MFNPRQFIEAARILRSLHDVTARWDGRGRAEVVCHGDASPCNFVFQRGAPYALIDFDAAHPGTRAADVGYAAWLSLDIGNPELDPVVQGRRLAAFVGAYGALHSPWMLLFPPWLRLTEGANLASDAS